MWKRLCLIDLSSMKRKEVGVENTLIDIKLHFTDDFLWVINNLHFRSKRQKFERAQYVSYA